MHRNEPITTWVNYLKQPLTLIVVLFLALGIYYSVTTPIFETPDEVWHFAYVRELALYHRLPIVDAEGKATYRHEGLQPPLYYAIGSLFIGWMNEQDLAMPTPNPFARIGDPQAQSNDNRNAFLHTADEQFPFHGTALAVHLIRLYSLCLGALTITMTYALGRRIFPQYPIIALGAATFVAFLPQFIFISGAVSNDNLATLLTVATLWQLAEIMSQGLSIKRTIFVGALAGAALLTKLNTIALAPLVVLTLSYVGLKKHNWGDALIHATILGGIVLVCLGWWYIRNLMLYGDFTTFGRLAVLVGERAQPLNIWRWFTAESEGLRLSMWGIFGWFNILAPTAFYILFDALALIGLAGIAVALVTQRNLSIGLGMLGLWCVMIFVALWGYASIIVTSQGRLLFPALPAWAILWSWGINTLIPPSWRTRAIFVLAIILVLASAYVPIGFIARAYMPTIVDPTTLAKNISAINLRFDNGIEWLGASIDQSTVRPGDTLTLTIYQRVPAGSVAKNAMFIHIVNSSQVIVAQRDSFIGNSNWKPQPVPVVLADTYTISIPLTVPAPDEWNIVAGLYDATTGERATANNSLKEISLGKIRAQAVTANSWNFDFDGRATLTHADLTQMSVTAGGNLPITLYWRNTSNTTGYNVFIHVLGVNDQTWGGADTALNTTRPMQINLRFDPNTPPGIYPLELGIYPAPDGDRVAVFDRNGQESGDRIFLGPVRVNAR